ERAVIGLNLCPFAKAVHVKGQVHYGVSHAASAEGVREALADELDALMGTDPTQRDTTMLMLPELFAEFLDFNDFLAEADNLLADKGLEGIVQIASFHPQFQFGGTAADDITNYTNRAPYPTLHLLREASVERAVEAFPEAEAIFEHNMQTLEKLGLAGWQALDVGPAPSAAKQ
ncbi:MAG: peptidase, partial [Pseudonocardiales bacterium]|nr:peptidase [Pseudonocardiales bacterium]